MSGDDVQGRMAATSGGGSLRSSRRKGRCRGRSGAAGSGKILASRRSRCAARPGSGAAGRRKHGGAEERRGAELVEAAARVYGGAWDGWDTGLRWAV